MYLTGVDVTETFNLAGEQSDKGFTLGSRYVDDDGKEFIFLEADEAITGDGYAVLVEADLGSQMVDSTSTAGTQSKPVAIARAAVTSGYGFWAQVYGISEVQVAASAAANSQLHCTATAGVLDDAATSGLEEIDGIWISETDGGSGGLVTCFLSHPRVGATV